MENNKNKQRPLARIGIDIGRVVICPTDALDGPDTSFLRVSKELAMAIPPAPGAEATIRSLVQATGGNVWFVSKAGNRIQALTREWFRHNDFHARTQTSKDSLHFCIERHEKRGIAQRLRLTHFIDDRQDVLSAMVGVVPNLYLFGVQSGPAPRWCTSVSDWSVVARLLLTPNLESG
jgi:hypothetical protein